MPEGAVKERGWEPCIACGHPKTFHGGNGEPCVAEKTLGTECWCPSYETDFAAGIELVLKYADPAGLVAATNRSLEREDHLSAQTLLDCYIRKTPQSERDGDWIHATERSIARVAAPGSGIASPPEQPFCWEDLDQRILRHKTNEVSNEMQKRAAEGERRVSFETAQSGNSAGYLPSILRIPRAVGE